MPRYAVCGLVEYGFWKTPIGLEVYTQTMQQIRAALGVYNETITYLIERSDAKQLFYIYAYVVVPDRLPAAKL